MSSFNVIVVGCGGLGSAALYLLARRLGPGVLGIEQFRLGHDRGASQDHSRIIRLAQHERQYAALAPHAYAAWHEVEQESGQRLVTTTGGLVIEDRQARAGQATGTRNMEATPPRWTSSGSTMNPWTLARSWRGGRSFA